MLLCFSELSSGSASPAHPWSVFALFFCFLIFALLCCHCWWYFTLIHPDCIRRKAASYVTPRPSVAAVFFFSILWMCMIMQQVLADAICVSGQDTLLYQCSTKRLISPLFAGTAENSSWATSSLNQRGQIPCILVNFSCLQVLLQRFEKLKTRRMYDQESQAPDFLLWRGLLPVMPCFKKRLLVNSINIWSND